MEPVLAVIGSQALWLTYIWLASAIIASWLSNRKGYGERPGLATGLTLSAIGMLIWLLWPARADSRWKLQGPFPWSKGGTTVAAARAQHERAEEVSGPEPGWKEPGESDIQP